MRIDHRLTGLANPYRTGLPESGSGYDECAFRIKDLATGTAVVLSAECRERFPTMKTILSIFITHPEIFAK
jgi:hypothetical protein